MRLRVNVIFCLRVRLRQGLGLMRDFGNAML